jgi:hypothetical protein
MKVRALKKYYYDKREYEAGEEFEIDDRQYTDINILIALGTIEKTDQPQSVKSLTTTYETRTIEAEKSEPGPMTTESAGALTGGQRRRYMRRDMTPEKT